MVMTCSIFADDENAALWKQIDNSWYLTDSDGKVLTGWQFVDGEWYFLNESGQMQTGWLKRGSTWYYLKSNGAMAIAWEYINGAWYYFNSNGAMQTGWLKRGNTWYYLQMSGAMVTGWEEIYNKKYYFNDTGAMASGWQKIDNDWYYFHSSGEAADSGIIDDDWYINNGKLDYDFTGIASDSAVSWYVKNGKVDHGYTGTAGSNGIIYNIKDGLVTSPASELYLPPLFSSVACDGQIHFGNDYDDYEIECVHACYCEVHSWTNPYSGHLGIDLVCFDPGREVYSVASGTVVYVHHQAYENDGYYGSHPGEAVAIYVGDGLIYEYHELQSNSVTVNVGDWVSAGEVVGKVGLTGVTTGYHIHFSVLYWLGAEYNDDLYKMPIYEGPSTDGYIQLNPLFFFGEDLARQTEKWYRDHKYEWYGYKAAIPGDPRSYPKLASRLLDYDFGK